MAEDLQYSARLDNKRKFDDHSGATSPSPATSASGRRPSGFSAPIISPTSGAAALSSYNNVPPPPDGIELAKKRAQEIAARLFSVAEAKRPKTESDGGGNDSGNLDFSSDQSLKPMGQSISLQLGGTNSTLSSHGYSGSNKKIEIPNGRVGVIIGRSGETIKYLQVQSGARIQITRDVDADINSQTRSVELIGTPEQISKAEQLINDVLSEAETGGSGTISARKFTPVPANSEHFSMKVPNNRVGLLIGKGGENIRNMQANCGARIQVIPLHLLPGDLSTERTVHIDGTKEQIELAKQLVTDVINSENRARNPQTGGFRPPRPPANWVPSGSPHMQQPNYGYMQPGAYPGPAPQYNMSQPPYVGYPPPAQQTAQATGYDYYNQQQLPPPSAGGSSVPLDSNNYNYNQMPTTAYNGQDQYVESTYAQSAVGYQQNYAQAGDYNQAGPQTGFAQPISNPQAGYSSAPAYGNAAPTTQEGTNPNYGVESSTQQIPPCQQPTASSQPGYAMTPTTQPGYTSQSSVQANFLQSAPSPQPPMGQKPQPSQAGYTQTAQVYGHSVHGFVSGALQTGYGQQQSYGGAPLNQTTSFPQQQTKYGDSYSVNAYSQPPYSSDGTPATSTEPAATNGVTNAAHQS